MKFILEVLGKSLYLSDLAYQQFIEIDPAVFFIPLLNSTDLSIDTRCLLFAILLKIVESDYCILSSLFAEFLHQCPAPELLPIFLEVIDAFVRNNGNEEVAPFCEFILELAMQLLNRPDFPTFASALLPIFSDLCVAMRSSPA
jgi:hypothetical protein